MFIQLDCLILAAGAEANRASYVIYIVGLKLESLHPLATLSQHLLLMVLKGCLMSKPAVIINAFLRMNPCPLETFRTYSFSAVVTYKHNSLFHVISLVLKVLSPLCVVQLPQPE